MGWSSICLYIFRLNLSEFLDILDTMMMSYKVKLLSFHQCGLFHTRTVVMKVINNLERLSGNQLLRSDQLLCNDSSNIRHVRPIGIQCPERSSSKQSKTFACGEIFLPMQLQ